MLQKIIYLGALCSIFNVIDGHILKQSRGISIRKPTFKCFEATYSPTVCEFKNVILTEEQPEWEPVPESSQPWTEVIFYNSIMPVYTNDICRVFPNITTLVLSVTNIKAIRENAFEGCSNVRNLNIQYNHITKLDINTFSSMPKLYAISLFNNNLTTFPMELIKNNAKLLVLDLNSNELSDIDEKELLKYAPILTDIGIDDNEISCVRFIEIYKNLKAKGISFRRASNKKERYYQTIKFNDQICVSDIDYVATHYRKNIDAKSGYTKIGVDVNFEENIKKRMEGIETKLENILEWIETQKQLTLKILLVKF